MILICVKWKIKPEHADDWIELSREFSEATRAEPGNVFYEWSRSIDDPTEYVLIEGFHEEGAVPHVTSEHFKKAQAELPKYLVGTPLIRNIQGQPVEWGLLAEFDLGTAQA
jgi:quinol monooxygenase YgiN